MSPKGVIVFETKHKIGLVILMGGNDYELFDIVITYNKIVDV